MANDPDKDGDVDPMERPKQAPLDRKPFEKRFDALRADGMLWHQAWRDLSRYILPTRGFFMGDLPNRGRTIDHKTILDGSPARASRILAAGLTSGLSSPARPWFKLGLSNAALESSDAVKIWLDMVQQTMLAVFAKSNVYGALRSAYEEIGTFGTAAMIVLEDFENVIRCVTFTIGEYYLGVGAAGMVNSFAREYWMTVGQLVEEFGIENVAPGTASEFKAGRVDGRKKVRHLIEPNDERIPDDAGFENMPFRSVYWEVGSGSEGCLRYGGFSEFPVLGPRWDLTTTADSYGRAPGWDALGDVKMLQKMTKDKLLALEKMIDPPVQVDASVQGDVATLPGGITRYSGSTPNAGVKAAYQIQPDLNAIDATIDRTRKSIMETYYADLFLMMAQTETHDMTAREVVERHEEKLLMLGPVLERLEFELLDPLIERTFAIMARAGIIPPPPPEIQGQRVDVTYISMLAQAQRMVGTTAIEQFSTFVGNLAAANPTALDKLDVDAAVDAYGDLLGVSPKIIRPTDAANMIRQERAKAQQAAQDQQNSLAAAQGAKTLSDTKVGEGNALEALLGRDAGGPLAGGPSA